MMKMIIVIPWLYVEESFLYQVLCKCFLVFIHILMEKIAFFSKFYRWLESRFALSVTVY